MSFRRARLLLNQPARPEPAPLPVPKKRVLFVCIGNSCRSQMAEGFARKYGGTIVEAYSAGTDPATEISSVTKKVMAELGIDLAGHGPKGLEVLTLGQFDVVVNMSGRPIQSRFPVREWNVEDPIGQPDHLYRAVRDLIETRVMELILELKNAPRPTAPPESPS
jgi:arsenate reductase